MSILINGVKVKARKIGNTYYLRIPRGLFEIFGIRDDDEFIWRVKDGKLMLFLHQDIINRLKEVKKNDE